MRPLQNTKRQHFILSKLNLWVLVKTGRNRVEGRRGVQGLLLQTCPLRPFHREIIVNSVTGV